VLGVGQEQILAACQKVFADKYSAKAIYYPINAGLLDEDTPMAVLVLEMIDARMRAGSSPQAVSPQRCRLCHPLH
jgi:pyruvate,water dikinase